MKQRVPIIAGNWKLNLARAASVKLVREIHFNLPYPGEVDIIVFPTALSLTDVVRELKDSYISVGAQNLYFEDEGAYTGEISGKFIKDAGAEFVLIGHSERRKIFNETHRVVNKKIRATLRNDLIPVLCVGETLEEREANQVEQVIKQQILNGLIDIEETDIKKIIIAYEPVWAIGTGKTASPDQVEGVHGLIRDLINETYGGVSISTRILYGGSVKAENSRELLSLPNVDGALVGGASLNAAAFIEIIKSALWMNIKPQSKFSLKLKN